MKRFVLTLAALLAVVAPAFAAADQFDLRQCAVHSAPADVADWPATRAITSLAMRPSGDPNNGLAFTFDQPLPDAWKFFTGNGGDNFQYTVWPVVVVNGQCHTAGIVQMWQGRNATGAPILTDFHKNWVYDPILWAPMSDYAPHPGDKMGFFVTAGNARIVRDVTSVRERSNVVVVTLPAGDTGDFAFADQAPPVVTPPVPDPVTPAPPTPTPSASNDEVLAKLAELKQLETDDTAKILAAIADLKQDIHNGVRQIGDTYLPLLIKVFGTGVLAPKQ